jgi:hypothetical protein
MMPLEDPARVPCGLSYKGQYGNHRHQEKPPLEIYLQSGQISFVLSKEGQLEELGQICSKFPWLAIYPHLGSVNFI